MPSFQLVLRRIIVVLTIAVFSGVVAAFAQENENLPGQPAYISYLAGNVDVDITPENEIEDFEIAELEMELPAGTIIRTGKKALCEIILADSSTVKISSSSVFRLDEQLYNADSGKKKERFSLIFGRVRAKVQKLLTSDSIFEIKSGTALAGVRGTSFGIQYDGAVVKVLTFEGSVTLSSAENAFEPIVIEQGQMSAVLPDGIPEPVTTIPEDVLNDWQTELDKFTTETAKAETTQPAVSQPKPAEKKGKKEGGISKFLSLNAYIGTVTIGNSVYARWVFTPELSVGKLGVGLFLPAIFSPDVGLFGFDEWENHDEWDFTDLEDGIHDLLIKFFYIRWGYPGDPLYVKVGGIDDFNLGHGFIVDNYTNIPYFPEELATGMQLNIDRDKWGLESMISDFSRLELYGMRLYLRPAGEKFPLAFGVTAVHDRPDPSRDFWPVGPLGELTQSGDQLPHIFVFGADSQLPILNLDMFALKLYMDAAKVGYSYKELPQALQATDYVKEGNIEFLKGLGTAAGLTGRITKIFQYRFEYRYIFDYYEPGLINSLWENRRLVYQQELLDLIFAQNDPGYEKSRSSGFFLSGGVNLFQKLEFGLGYENYEKNAGSSSETIQKGNAYVNVNRGLIPKVFGSLSYDRNAQLENVFNEPFDENTVLKAEVYYELAPGFAFSGNLKRTFRYNDETGENEPIDSFGISTVFMF